MEIIKSQQGFLTILTGKTDMGKSTMTIYDCAEQLRDGKHVLFFSYEYCQSIIYNKLISHFSMRWQDLFKLNIVDSSGLTLQNVIETIKQKKGDVDVVYIDYLDLLQKCSFPGNIDETNQLEEIQVVCRELAKLAREQNISIVLLSQTGSAATFEETVDQLNSFTDKINPCTNVIKMFIGKGSVIDSRIEFDQISHVILIDGYNLRHFSTVNIKEIYKD